MNPEIIATVTLIASTIYVGLSIAKLVLGAGEIVTDRFTKGKKKVRRVDYSCPLKVTIGVAVMVTSIVILATV
jgi:hypothetical protein